MGKKSNYMICVSKKPKKALVLDDNELLRKLMSTILRSKNFEVFEYSSPIEFLSQNPICNQNGCDEYVDLILTDNQMPGMTGLEFLEMIRGKGCTFNNRLVGIVSGYFSNEQLERARSIGVNIFHKPMSMNDISNWIDQCPI